MMAGTPMASHSAFKIWAAFSSSGEPAMRVKPIFSSSSISRFPQISTVNSSFGSLIGKAQTALPPLGFCFCYSYITLTG